MPYESQERCCLVTGASRGLGRAIAAELGSRGRRVVVAYCNSRKAAEDTAAAVQTAGGEAICVAADLRNPDDIERMSAVIMQRWGVPALLVNNAGVARDSLLAAMTEAAWDDVLAVNLSGAICCCKIFAPLMAEAGGGHMINIASLSGIQGRAGQANYAASKGALIGFTQALAAELGPSNVRANVVVPGYLPTDMGLAANTAKDRAQEASLLKRLGDTEETAQFVADLSALSSVTGQIFRIDSRP